MTFLVALLANITDKGTSATKGSQMFKHNKMAAKMRSAGVTRERATVKVNALFARHGHFPRNPNQQVALDALKELAYS